MSSFPTALPESRSTPLRGGPTVRWGVLAPGGIANDFVTTLHANTDQRVAAVASRSPERAGAFAAKHGIPTVHASYEALVGDPGVDVVYIAAPHSEHLALALLAIGAGKHVLIEKPIAVSADQAREIRAAARATGVFAMEAMWSRFLPQSSVVAQLLEHGVLGEIGMVTADFSVKFDFDPTGRAFDPALGGGALLDLGVYPTWFSHFVLGAPSAVTARGSLASTGVDDQAVVTLEHAGGAIAAVTTSMRAQGPVGASIAGTEGTLVYPAGFPGPAQFELVSRGGARVAWQETDGFQWRDGLCYQATAVAQYIADGLTESPIHSLQDSIEILEVLDEARRQLGAR